MEMNAEGGNPNLSGVCVFDGFKNRKTPSDVKRDPEDLRSCVGLSAAVCCCCCRLLPKTKLSSSSTSQFLARFYPVRGAFFTRY
jgi:hypothetical protein